MSTILPNYKLEPSKERGRKKGYDAGCWLTLSPAQRVRGSQTDSASYNGD